MIGDFTGITPAVGEGDDADAEDHDAKHGLAPAAPPSFGSPYATLLPRELSLARPSPNPAHGITEIRYSLPQATHVSLAVFDVNGRRVRTLVQGPVDAGEHGVSFALADGQGRPLSMGLYFVRLEAGGRTLTTRLVASP